MDTWFLEFQLKPGSVAKHGGEIITSCEKLIPKILDQNSKITYKDVGNGIKVLWVANQSGLTVLLQSSGDVLTFNINWPKMDDAEFRKNVKIFEDEIRELDMYQKPKTKEFQVVPPIKRGREFLLYDGGSLYLAERDFDKILYDEMSPYQCIRIFHSPQYGNVLYLDNEINIAESDIEYTRGMTGWDLEDYKDKTVLILGGGDGGILHYLRDRGPKMITMIDIDQMVIDVAKVYLRGVCHDVLDQLTGTNYEVIVDDCVKYLKQYIKEGRKFDYVINDLTDIPIKSSDQGDGLIDVTDFPCMVTSLALEVVEDTGKYFGYGTGHHNPAMTEAFENFLRSLKFPVKFHKKAASVPSFLENWWIYTVQKQ